jgi:hypothetical protein
MVENQGLKSISWGLSVGDEVCWHVSGFVDHWSPPEANRSPESLLHEVLASPLGYPPLYEALVPGDRVAIALHPGVPSASEIIRPLIDRLLAAQPDLESITVVTSTSDMTLVALNTQQEVQDEHAPAKSLIRWVVHRPNDPPSMAYLAADEEAEPIYVQRDLVDADFLLPIQSAANCRGLGAVAPFSMAPDFVDSATARRWEQQWAKRSGAFASTSKAAATSDTTLQSLVQGLSIVVVEGRDESIAAIQAGEARSMEQWLEQALLPQAPARSLQASDLVVASLIGNSDRCTWHQVARVALHLASQMANDSLLVVASSLDQSPRGHLRTLLHGVGKESPTIPESGHELFAAAALMAARKRCRLAFACAANRSALESMGMGVIDSQSQLQSIIDRAKNPVLVQSALAACSPTATKSI